jgi:hypothetical protein
MNLPAIVFPIHDPKGMLFHHLESIIPDLKLHFSNAFLGITPITVEKYQHQINILARDDFFQLLIMPKDAQIGRQFKLLYQHAVLRSQPDRILHLCYPDRLALALQDEFRDQFLKDIQAVTPENTPIIFQRSPQAWQTHPSNYYETERFVSTIGKHLFGKKIDFAWCHLVLQASLLTEILPQIHKHDLSMVAEMILPIINSVKTQDVDWLAWEDPFLHARNAETLKIEREISVIETRKRLSYVIPMVQLLADYAASM